MDISGTNTIIGAEEDNRRDFNSGSGYVYTKIDRKWTNNFNIVPDNGAADEWFVYSVAILGSTALFGAPLVG